MSVLRSLLVCCTLLVPCAIVGAQAQQAQPAAPRPQAAAAQPKSAPPTTPQREAARSLSAADVERMLIDLESIKRSLEELRAQRSIRDWAPWAPVFAAVVAAGFAYFSLTRQIRMGKEALAEKSREEEREAIRAQINQFYGPFLQLRNASKFFYQEAFLPRRTPDELKRYGDASGNYRTVVALASAHKFQGIDATLLEVIVELGKKTAELIYTKIGLVDDLELQNALARATTHFKIIEIAATQGERLSGVGEEVQKFTFPSELDEKVQRKLEALSQRLMKLQRG